jgi:hypothetical protein
MTDTEKTAETIDAMARANAKLAETAKQLEYNKHLWDALRVEIDKVLDNNARLRAALQQAASDLDENGLPKEAGRARRALA